MASLTADQYRTKAEEALASATQNNSSASNAGRADSYAHIADGYIALYVATKDETVTP